LAAAGRKIMAYFFDRPEAKDIYRRKNWVFPGSIDRVYVCDKAKQVLGYRPQFDFEYLLHQ
jgi:nucleoside-diphosphate-sugar epimerase